MFEYGAQSDPKPLLTQYNETTKNEYPLIGIDELSNIRGAGLYNPGPKYIQTTDRGNAWDNIKSKPDPKYYPVSGNLYVNPSGAVDVNNTWETNIDAKIEPDDGSNYKNYDEFQRFALNATRKIENILQPYFFSSINVKFIQNKVVDYIKKETNITIETKQDTDNLLQLMLSVYNSFYSSTGVLNADFNKTNEKDACNFSRILGICNQKVMETYIKNVLSTLNMTEYYFNDISKLPIPMSNPVTTDLKGSRTLGFVGFFEDNHDFTKNINSFNARDTQPGKINSVSFGN